MKRPNKGRRNLSVLPPLTPSYEAPHQTAPITDWERYAKRNAHVIVTQNNRINALCAHLRDVRSQLLDLQKRLRFIENAPKMKAGPR